MATFEAQINGLTGLGATLSASTTPTDDELDQFLKDGVLDVTRRCIQAKPQEASKFQRESSISDSQGVSVGGARILSVVREANADGSSDGSSSWRQCRQVPAHMQSRVIDTDSLHFASIYNPVYIIDDNNAVNVYPVPSSNNGFKVYYVNEEPRDISGGAALIHSHSNIKYFPNDKVYLVVIYAAIKCLEAKMAEFAIDEEDVELVQAITSNLTSLKQQYEGAFASMAPPQQQAAGGRR